MSLWIPTRATLPWPAYGCGSWCLDRVSSSAEFLIPVVASSDLESPAFTQQLGRSSSLRAACIRLDLHNFQTIPTPSISGRQEPMKRRCGLSFCDHLTDGLPPTRFPGALQPPQRCHDSPTCERVHLLEVSCGQSSEMTVLPPGSPSRPRPIGSCVVPMRSTLVFVEAVGFAGLTRTVIDSCDSRAGHLP